MPSVTVDKSRHLEAAARMLAAAFTRPHSVGASVLSADDSESLLRVFDIDWPSAPWARTNLAEPFSDYAARTRDVGEGSPVLISNLWKSWIAGPVLGFDPFASSLSAAVERAPRLPADFLLTVENAVATAAPEMLCAPEISVVKRGWRRLDATMRLQV